MRAFTSTFLLAASAFALAACQTNHTALADGQLGSYQLPGRAAAAQPQEPGAVGEPTPPSAYRNSEAGRQGKWELTLGANGANDEDFEAGLAQMTGSAGYYLTDDWQVLVRQNLAFADSGNGFPDLWNGSTRVALDYHLLDGPVRPFVGVNAGAVYGDTIKETMVAAPEAGVKWYVKDEAFIQLMAEYQFFIDKDDTVGAAFETGQFVYGMGIGLVF